MPAAQRLWRCNPAGFAFPPIARKNIADSEVFVTPSSLSDAATVAASVHPLHGLLVPIGCVSRPVPALVAAVALVPNIGDEFGLATAAPIDANVFRRVLLSRLAGRPGRALETDLSLFPVGKCRFGVSAAAPLFHTLQPLGARRAAKPFGRRRVQCAAVPASPFDSARRLWRVGSFWPAGAGALAATSRFLWRDQ